MKSTKRFLPILFVVALVLCAALSVAAADEYIAGNSAGSSMFNVQAYYGNAYVDLNAYQGKAVISMPNGYQSMVMESLYGFYTVTVSGESYSRTYYWTPSKTVNAFPEYANSAQLRITLPKTGSYTIQVMPFAAYQINSCRSSGQFSYWTNNATWVLAGECGCRASTGQAQGFGSLNVKVNCYDNNGNFLMTYTDTVQGDKAIYPREISGYYCRDYSFLRYYPDAPMQDMYTVTFTYFRAAGEVDVYCFNEYNLLIDSYTETIYDSQYIQPRAESGYNTLSAGEYVTLNRQNNTCMPSTVNFYYRSVNAVTAAPAPVITAAPAPVVTAAPSNQQPAPQIGDAVKPSSWSTQFTEREDKLYRLSDDDAETFFWWHIVDSERVDKIPELTAYFKNATISTIGIRSGRPKQYKNYARVKSFRLVIYHSGGMSTVNVSFPDRESVSSYHTASLGGTYKGVTKIEIFLDKGTGEGFYPGTGNGKNYVYVKDIKFGK